MLWRVFVVWECQVMRDPKSVLLRIARLIDPSRQKHVQFPIPSRKKLLKAAEERLHNSLDNI